MAMLLSLMLLPWNQAQAITEPATPTGAELDARSGSRSPSAAQLASAEAQGLRVTWNRFGTPQSVFKFDGWLATGLSSDAVEAARQYLAANKQLLGVSQEVVDGLVVVNDARTIGNRGHAVTLAQTFGGKQSTLDGLVIVGVRDGKVAYMSSSLAPTTATPEAATLQMSEAVATAVTNAGYVASPSVAVGSKHNDWTTFSVTGTGELSYARPTVLTGYDGDVRPAYEVLALAGAGNLGYRTFVDGITGEVLYREDLMNYAADNPRWKFFDLYPKLDYSGGDTRTTGCWTVEPDSNLECEMKLQNPASPLPWDVEGGTEQPSFTTKGNNANAALSTLNPLGPSDNYRPISPDREYLYPFTNYWYENKCQLDNPDFNANDINSAIVNLFDMHNRMHDWAYYLGFTEENYNMQDENFGKGGTGGDAQVGAAQAAAVSGNIPQVGGRNNANQRPTPDGVPPITNMYLWQPAAGGAYPPCVDGDFDMTVVAHEYTHATSNRMIGGPSNGISGVHGRSMGESWSDLAAIEYGYEYGYAPVGNENPYAVGAYVTGQKKTGIRNYVMSKSPLNFSNMDYDFVTGDQVHANGEIWSATNFDIRKAFIKKYNKRFPASNGKLQKRCANGKVKVQNCPGNRRWIQIMHDAFLLEPSALTMLDARDAYLAADKMRFNSANKKLLWKAFAKRGFGADARAAGTSDMDPTPSFRSPVHKAGTLTFKAINKKGKEVPAQFYVGMYEARVTPVANTQTNKMNQENSPFPIVKKAKFIQGRYKFNVRADGYGQTRFKVKAVAGRTRKVVVKLQKNLASKTNGAAASGSGTDHELLIDDTEGTNWGALGVTPNVKGAAVTVDLAGGRKLVRFVQVSATLRPRDQLPNGDPDPRDLQGRFSTLRRFAIQVCTAKTANAKCTTDKGFKTIYKSKPNAFPGVRMRPQSPKLIMRRFNIPDRRATHIRLVVLENQCTGGPDFQAKANRGLADCDEGSTEDENVRAAEFQVFGKRSRVVRR
jgi:hypothetical protein